MSLLPILLSILLQPSDLQSHAGEIAAAFEASDVARLTRLWSDDAPSRNPARKRLVRMMSERPRLTTSVDEARRVIALELRDDDGILLERHELQFAEDNGQWRVRALETLRGDDGTLPFARALLHDAIEQLDLGQFDEARRNFTKAGTIADALGHAATRVRTRIGLGTVAITSGDAATARRLFDEAQSIAVAAGDRRSLARVLERLAHADRVTGQLARGQSRLEEALRIHEELGDRLPPAHIHIGIGNMRSMQGDQTSALAHYEKARQIFEAAGDIDGSARVLNNLGIAHRLQGRYAQSAELFRLSIERSRATDDAEGVAFAQGNLGIALAMQGKLTEALNAYHDALALNEQLGRANARMLMLNNIGELYRMLGNFAQARQHFERARALAEAAGFQPALASSLQHLASVHRNDGDLAGAIALFEKALALTTAMGDQHNTALILHNIGVVHFLRGDRATARASFARAVAIAESIENRETLSIALGMSGETAERPEDAIPLSRRSLALAMEMGLPERIWHSHLGLARSYRRAGRAVEARAELERAIAVIEERRRAVPGDETTQQQAFALMVRPYQEMAGLLIEAGDLAGALEYAERAKARALLDVLRGGKPDVDEVLTESERSREAELSARLAELNRAHRDALLARGDSSGIAAEVRAARLRYDDFIASIYAAHPQLRIEAGEIEPMRAADVTALLAGGAADVILEYVVTDERTYLFTMKAGGGNGLDLRAWTLEIPHGELQREVRRFRELLANRDLTYGESSRALYDRLLRPAAEQLRGAKSIAIVADGPLWELPFQALQPARGEFLLDRHALYYAPSLSVLREMSARPSKGHSSILAIGNPLLPKSGTSRARQLRGDAALPPLPQTENEIRGIASLYEERRVRLRGDAREELVKSEARTFDVLHFATHAVLDDHNALYSRLVLSPSATEREDGLLEAREIMRLDLRAELAVLSACETARGRVGEGEGLIGMSWALFVAGVPTSIVSQWKVDSQSTSELMIDFHRALRGSPRTKAEALRHAALKTKARAAYRHPFYWAPFVVVGSAR